jgi:hypothetical protein
MSHNVLALGEEADFEALNCLPALNLIRSRKLQLTTEPAFLPNACYKLAFFQSRSESICLESFFIESKAIFALSIFSCVQVVGSAQYSALPNNRK